MVRPRLGRTRHEEKERQSQLCDTDPSPMQHLSREGLLSSPINQYIDERGIRSFDEASGGPVSTNQDGDFAVKQRPHT